MCFILFFYKIIRRLSCESRILSKYIFASILATLKLLRLCLCSVLSVVFPISFIFIERGDNTSEEFWRFELGRSCENLSWWGLLLWKVSICRWYSKRWSCWIYSSSFQCVISVLVYYLWRLYIQIYSIWCVHLYKMQ